MKKIVFFAVFAAFLWIPILLVVGYSFAVNMRISEQAMQLAHGRPYCIMVAKNHEYVYKGVTSTYMEYETADSFMDTMGLLMMGGKARNHAVLVVGYMENEVDYHWSYWNFGFMKGALGPFHSCANYKFDYSNLKPSDYLETTHIDFGGKTYAIPLVYQPRAYIEDPESSNEIESFRFITYLPDFQPVKKWCSDGTCHVIHVSISDGKWPQAKRYKKRSGEGDAHVIYGLQEGAGSHDPGEAGVPGKFEPWGNYYATDDNGKITTHVHCLSNCDITFDKDGFRVFFSMRSENLQQWKAYEEKIADFIEGFRSPHQASTPEPAVSVPPIPGSA